MKITTIADYIRHLTLGFVCANLALLSAYPKYVQADIAQVPLFITTGVEPNIVITWDDSVSMLASILVPGTRSGYYYWDTETASFAQDGVLHATPFENDFGTIIGSGEAVSLGDGLTLGIGNRTFDFDDGVINILPVDDDDDDGDTDPNISYLANNAGGTVNCAIPVQFACESAIAPFPQFAFARSAEHNRLWFNPEIDYVPYTSTNTHVFTDINPTAAPTDPTYGLSQVVTQLPGDLEYWDLTAYQQTTGVGGEFEVQKNMVIPSGTRMYDADSDSWITTTSNITVSETDNYAIRYFPATFYSTSSSLPSALGYTASAVLDGYDPFGSKNLYRYEIKPENFANSANYAAMIQNFANWFSYYRTRHGAARAGFSVAFGAIEDVRMDILPLNGDDPSGLDFDTRPLNMRSLSSADDKARLFDEMFTYAHNWGGTPNLAAHKHVGEQFQRTDADAPITHECQKNFVITFTDGYSTDFSINENDEIRVSLVTTPDMESPINTNGVDDYDSSSQALYTQFGAGSAPYKDNYGSTMADWAMYYYANNLRPDLPAGKVPVIKACKDGTAAPDQDCNTNLHLVTHVLTLNGQGDIFGVDIAATNDPYNNPPTWPKPDYSPRAMDDMFHATINSRGNMFDAHSPEEVTLAFENVLAEVLEDTTSATAVAASSYTLRSDAFIFQALFNSGDWSGDVIALPINSDGSLGSRDWSAADKLANKAANDRVILSYDPTTEQGIALRWNNLDSSQQQLLNVDPITGIGDTNGAARLAYLRGDQSQEEDNGGPFRNRSTVLGDIIHSTPNFVGPPAFPYPESLESASYSSFKLAHANRAPMLLVGANDGMLHIFKATANNQGGGEELLAYAPNLVFDKLNKLTNPDYVHQFYVNGPPTVIDAVLDDNQWHTVAVGSLGAGGKGYYALDITNANNAAETAAASTVLWEFTDPDLGYTIGQASVVKLPSGEWAAVFGNGYGSTNHQASLYVVDLASGDLISKFDTGVGDADNPNGLTSPVVVDINRDYIADYVYAGDLHGNLWKFDFSSQEVLFEAADNATTPNPQPITVLPAVGLNPHGDGQMIYFGTGKYFELEDNDVSAPKLQSFYAVIDDNTPPLAPMDRDDLLQQTIDIQASFTFPGAAAVDERTFDVRVTSDYALSPLMHKGWYLDLVPPSGVLEGERVINNPVLKDGKVIFTTTIPSNNPCDFGGSGWLMEFDAQDGGPLAQSPFDLNADGVIDETDLYNSGNLIQAIGGKQSKVGLPQTPTIVDAGRVEYKYVSGSTTTSGDGSSIEVTRESSEYNELKRLYWMQLQ